ncbi:hypothetical protein DFP94_11471 [Fontibacillus phaseoli]|uniref:LAGLIDADG DNA endonuclease family protein n=1 Tax=Fontibacillus phaseoli TaxID=1416533 RepID=A0A369B2F2_9BACL|nr:hypothetical protein [Fontibacillus phaseoli]RCX15623.1 hypothetical protein DFP94_11471 [Fontibacillus phaseoli]
MAQFEKHSLPIDLGTPYLTNESAYFLGGIIAADETVIINGVRYWISPVRHNNDYPTASELLSHFDSVSSIANILNKITFWVEQGYINGNVKAPKFTGRQVGFVTLFPEIEETTVEELASLIEEVIKHSSDEVIRCFIAGIFDGRGAIDFNYQNNTIRYISLDCDNTFVVRILRSILSDFATNYNTARERLEGGTRRDKQLRIENISYYYKTIGFVSDVKFNKILEVNTNYAVNYEDSVLKGLKTIN